MSSDVVITISPAAPSTLEFWLLLPKVARVWTASRAAVIVMAPRDTPPKKTSAVPALVWSERIETI